MINNAGFGTKGVFEAATDQQIKKQFDVNLLGLIDVTRAVLPLMRENKSGTIINLSSIGGRISYPFNSLYHASKYAVEGLSESLQYELHNLGIKVKLIEPGAFNTNFGTSSLILFDATNYPDYHDGYDKFTTAINEMRGQSGDPQDVVDTIFEAATDNSDRLRYVIGKDAEKLLQTRKSMDDIEFKTMVLKHMGLNK